MMEILLIRKINRLISNKIGADIHWSDRRQVLLIVILNAIIQIKDYSIFH